jgi:hypothetical protein
LYHWYIDIVPLVNSTRYMCTKVPWYRARVRCCREGEQAWLIGWPPHHPKARRTKETWTRTNMVLLVWAPAEKTWGYKAQLRSERRQVYSVSGGRRAQREELSVDNTDVIAKAAVAVATQPHHRHQQRQRQGWERHHHHRLLPCR